ncbi:hypothetical protein QFZ66_006225 [Streptomyces sp. B4I13]|uniref:hypothetical protein n=1 Tax=Streptomyces sp. B4I13 TaxID=3042271 RepID=UPI0027868582|nr:hypothetical protein [Streptomyces sp. B4I13]MDQ0962347.1 hypothetical protein [Streptomyces sp. B4I13]
MEETAPSSCRKASAANGTDGAAARKKSGTRLQSLASLSWQVSLTMVAITASSATAILATAAWMLEKVRSSSRAIS